jgi:hypothetical protein
VGLVLDLSGGIESHLRAGDEPQDGVLVIQTHPEIERVFASRQKLRGGGLVVREALA